MLTDNAVQADDFVIRSAVADIALRKFDWHRSLQRDLRILYLFTRFKDTFTWRQLVDAQTDILWIVLAAVWIWCMDVL